jgi:Uma2 family endonuclease
MTVAIERPTQQKPITFEEFLIQYGDDDRHELIDGEVFDLESTGPHEEVETQLASEPLWSREAIIVLGSSIKLVVEVVSSNWQNDYARKVDEYALLSIPEYWIADYAALGGIDYIGRPKQPTLTICTLNSDGSYDKRRLRGGDAIVSTINLTLTAAAVLGAGR